MFWTRVLAQCELLVIVSMFVFSLFFVTYGRKALTNSTDSIVICGERLQGLVSDGSLYYKPLPHRGTAKSTIGTVKGKEYK